MVIVYYSVSNGNTKRIAQWLQKATDADIAQIETVKPYTGSTMKSWNRVSGKSIVRIARKLSH